MQFLLSRFFILLLLSPLLSAQALPINRYTTVSAEPPIVGLYQEIEKYILGRNLTLKDFLIETLRGTGMSLAESQDPILEFRLNQMAPDAARLQKGSLLRILTHLVGDGYQVIYDPVHALVSFRIQAKWKKLIGSEKDFFGGPHA
jgi:hypothetical protein